MMSRLAYVLLPLLLTFTYQLVARPADASSIISREEAPSSCVDCRSQRTLFNIIWGCVSTTIICGWAAIHPNIPPREGSFKGTLRKLELMLWTIVAPEILPAWALNQLLAAMTVRDIYNRGKGYEKEAIGFWKTVKGCFSLYEIKEAANPAWTLMHGHFLIMGGIRLVEPPEAGTTTGEQNTVADQSEAVNLQLKSTPSVNADTEEARAASRHKVKPKEGRVTILTLEMLEVLVEDREFDIQLTEDEITHMSKGDALSKVILLLQTTWFITQCLGRRIKGLDLTQLELTTLALASLNGITFILWWDKPLGAQTLVRVYLKRKLTDVERKVEGRGTSGRSQIIPNIQTFFKGPVTTIHDIILCQSERNIFVDWLIRLPFFILLLLLSPIIAFAFALFATIVDLVGQSPSFPADATHVPTLYVPNHRYSKLFHVLLLMAFGSIFGGIHCAGWNLPFPTYTEQKLWRIASLAITITPIAAFPLTRLITVIVRCSGYDGVLGAWALVISLLACVCARLVLIGLALALLRHLPPSALITVNWTKFYPHFV